jgi:hypothetical protein
MRRLREEEIAKLIFPTFDEEKRKLPKGAVSCTGRPLLDDPVLAGGAPIRGGEFVLQEGDFTYGSGGDRIKVVWLKMLGWPDGTVGGPLAIVRSNERFAELFAVAAYRGRADRAKLGTERMGTEFLVTAEDDECSGRKPGAGCETRMTLFLPRQGSLGRVVDVPVEKVAYVARAERGASGTLEYTLTSAATYKDDGIHLIEQVRVKDESGAQIRKAEAERLFAFDGTGQLSSTDAPLWDHVLKTVAPREAGDAGAPARR